MRHLIILFILLPSLSLSASVWSSDIENADKVNIQFIQLLLNGNTDSLAFLLNPKILINDSKEVNQSLAIKLISDLYHQQGYKKLESRLYYFAACERYEKQRNKVLEFSNYNNESIVIENMLIKNKKVKHLSLLYQKINNKWIITGINGIKNSVYQKQNFNYKKQNWYNYQNNELAIQIQLPNNFKLKENNVSENNKEKLFFTYADSNSNLSLQIVTIPAIKEQHATTVYRYVNQLNQSYKVSNRVIAYHDIGYHYKFICTESNGKLNKAQTASLFHNDKVIILQFFSNELTDSKHEKIIKQIVNSIEMIL